MLINDPHFPLREWISSIRSALDFTPQRSLIVILLPDQPTDHTRASVSCVDFNARAPILTAWLRRRIAETGAGVGYTILVDDRTIPEFDHPAYRLVDYLTDAFAEGPFPLAASWATRTLTPGQPWWPLPGNEDSTTAPHVPAELPALSYTQRLGEVLTPDLDLLDAVAAELPAALDARSRRARADHDEHVRDLNRRDLELVLETIAEIDDDTPTARRLARAAAALSIPAVAQCLHATAASEYADAAEALWALLGRCLYGPLRATPVMLLAYSAFLRGDSALASVATSVALRADSGEVTARLIYHAFDNPLLARSLDVVAGFGAAAATDLGITIDYTAPD